VKTWIDWRAQQAGAAFGIGFVGPTKSVDVVSKYVVRITVKSPNPELPYAFAEYGFNWGNVQSPKAVAAAAANPQSTIFTQGTYGLGPYKLDASQSVIGDHCTYVQNPYYPGASKLKFGTVVTKNIFDPNTLLAAIESGQVDVGVASNGSIVPAAKAAGFKAIDVKSLLVSIRQALNYALDRKAIVNAVYPNSGFPTSSPDPVVVGNSPKYDNFYAYNPAKAKALLAASGHANGLTLKVLAAQGGFGFGLDQVAQLACKYWEAVGVHCDLTVQPLATWFGQLSSGKYSVSAGIVALSPVWSWFTQSMVPNPSSASSGADQHGWFDTQIKNLWLQGQRLSGTSALPYWQRIIQRGVQSAITVPVASPGAVFLISKRVGGVQVTVPGVLNVATWFPAGK
jgi:peptide/nickel transport system substrate-binding protein